MPADATPLEISLIVPVHGRADAFAKLLDSLKQQTIPAGRWELIVLDDGTPAPQDAEIRHLVESSALPCKFERISPPRGPAHARNRGVQLARAPLVLFLNSDVILSPRHIERHLEAQSRHAGEAYAAHGETPWHPEVLRGSLMECLRRGTFLYDAPMGDEERNFVYFISSSLSIRRDLMLKYPFDESFRDAAFEDTEVAMRLIRREGLKVELLRGDPALHWHYHTPKAFIRRARTTGRNAVKLLKFYPEFSDRLIGCMMTPAPKWRWLRAAGFALTGDMVGFWKEIETAAYVKAFWDAMKR